MVRRQSVGGACWHRHRPAGIRKFSRCYRSQTVPAPSAKRERVEGLHGQKVVGAFVQIASGRQMSMAKKCLPRHGTVASAPLRLAYGMRTKRERGQNLRSTTTLHVSLLHSTLCVHSGVPSQHVVEGRIPHQNQNPKYIGEVERIEKTISVDALARIAAALKIRLRDLMRDA
jgi:hypothetical protein